MRLLVTRAAEDASRMRTDCRAMGHEVLLAPLLDIALLPPAELPSAAALIATSRHALAALASSSVLAAAIRMPLYCPGPGAAALARGLGFQIVRQGAGDAASIPDLIAGDGAPGPFLYLSGDETAFDMEAALAERGLAVVRRIVYRAEAVTRLPAEAEAALRAGALDGVALMSPRTARIYARLCLDIGCADAANRVVAFCLSHNVARALAPLRPPVRVAATPAYDAMLALLKN
ncbi:MAG: uroporphyrinogen-III synthase [Hyphomicrobiales bacterium]|nr:uroporphyrinogen-III synthase [Hyphomicrobiales bacterium]